MKDEQVDKAEFSKPAKKQLSFKDYFAFGDVFKYFFRVFKKDKTNNSNFNLRMMHGINKISILMFLFALIFWIIRRLT